MITPRATPLLADITPSPTNPRKHFNETELAELASSIKEHGIISPILVRTNPNHGPTEPYYELISGERRWRAAKLAGLTQIPADVRDDLSDAAIVEIQLIENLQRQDLHPLEEAEGYGRMLRQHGYTADTLAKKIGKSRSYIFGRLKLLDLDEDGRRLFSAGALNPSTALLVARIPSRKLQARAIEDITRQDFNGDTMSVRWAQRHIRSRYMLDLDKAPFPTEDSELIATAGGCSGCPKRTGNSPDLFDDVDNANVCTDPDCFTAKKIAASERRAREAGPDVKVVTGEEAEKIMPSYAAESRTHAKLDAVCYDDPKHRTYREIIGDDQSAVTLVENAHKGELVPVVAKKVVTEKLKAQGVVTRAQETRDENKKIKAQVALANDFRDRLFRRIREEAREASWGKDPHGYNFGQLLCDALPVITRRFLIDAGNTRAENVASLYGAIGANSFDRTEAFRKGLAYYGIEEMLLICLDLTLLAELKTDEHNLKRDPESMLAMAKALEIDTDALLKAAKEAQKPAPKAKKTGKKSVLATSEDDSPPSEAAQAAETNRACEGEDATEAARAGGEESLEGQNHAPADAEADLSSGSIEPNEKPSQERPAFRIGDRIRITGQDEDLNDLRGKLGTIIESHNGGIGKPFLVIAVDDGEEITLYEEEIELEGTLSSAATAAVEEPIPTAKLGELPNKHGVYRCEPDEVFKWSEGRNKATVKILELKNGLWLFTVNTETATGSSSGPLTIRNGTPRSRDEALRATHASLLRANGFLSELKEKAKAGLINFAKSLIDATETSIESDAKQSEIEEHSFGIGDTVRVNPELEKHGIPHTSSGKGGVIEAIYIDGRPAPIVVTIEGDELCFEPAELILIATASGTNSSRPSVQYRHPQATELEWTGRGRKPKWVEDWITQGGTLEDLKIEGAAA